VMDLASITPVVLGTTADWFRQLGLS